MNRESKENHPIQESYLEQDIQLPVSGWFIAASLIVALILNFLPLPEHVLNLRPDFVALTIAYWIVNHPYKMGMSAAFSLGLMMDAGNVGLLGQHALAYCVVVYLALVFGRRLRLFGALQQAPQIGLVLFVMQLVTASIAMANDAPFPGWHYFLATASGIMFWVPISWLFTMLLQPKPDPDAL